MCFRYKVQVRGLLLHDMSCKSKQKRLKYMPLDDVSEANEKTIVFSVTNIPELRKGEKGLVYTLTKDAYEKNKKFKEAGKSTLIVNQLLDLAKLNVKMQKYLDMEKMLLQSLSVTNTKFTFVLDFKSALKLYKGAQSIDDVLFKGSFSDIENNKIVEVCLQPSNCCKSLLQKLNEKRNDVQESTLLKWKLETESLLSNMFYRLSSDDIARQNGKTWCVAAEFYTFNESGACFELNEEKLHEYKSKKENVDMAKHTVYPRTIALTKVSKKSSDDNNTASLDGGIVLLARAQIKRAADNNTSWCVDKNLKFEKWKLDLKDQDVCLEQLDKSKTTEASCDNCYYCDTNEKVFWKASQSQSLTLAKIIKEKIALC